MLDIVSLIIISVFVGFIGSLSGLGGASIIIPVLVLFGIPLKEAIASAMISIIATSSGSAASYVRQNIVNIKVAMFLEIFTVIGAVVGAKITVIIPSIYLYFFFAIFLMTSFIKIRSIYTEFIPVTTQDRISKWLNFEGSYYDNYLGKQIDYKLTNAIPGGLGMLVAGLAAGMLGIGAGAFKVTVHENILHMPPKVSSTTSNFIIGMTALAGTSVYFLSGFLNITLMAPVAIGSTIGALLGGRILNRIPDKKLKILFFLIVSYLITQMLYKGITLL